MALVKSFFQRFYFLTFVIPVTVLLILFFAFIYFSSFPILEFYLMEGKKSIIVEQVRTAESFIYNYWKLSDEGVISQEEAKEKSRELLRSIRYGKENKDYFFIVDENYLSVMHPLRKSLEGTDMSDVTDVNGKRYIHELINIAKDGGEGFVTYFWYVNGAGSLTLPKISYCRYFEPWGWVIGTGIFVYDVENYVNKEKLAAFKLILIFICISLVIAIAIVIIGTKSEKNRIEAEKKLSESEMHYRTLFESSKDAILIIGPPNWNYLDVNSAACKLFGIKNKEEFKSLTPNDLSPEKQPDGSNSAKLAKKHIERAIKDGSVYFEWTHQRLDGTQFISTVMVSKITLHNKNLLLGTIRDITKEKELEEQLIHSQKMDSIGQLAGGIVHDFNNFLGGIIGFSEILSDQLEEGSDSQTIANRITEVACKMTSLTGKLLAFSRKEKLQTIPIDISKLINDMLVLLKRSIDPRIKIILEKSNEPKMILGDPGLIESAILNLCTNARDAMTDGGDLTIKISTAGGKEHEGFSKYEKVVVIDIIDDGSGIPDNVQNKIFEPFFTTKDFGKGTGLGLAAVYRTIKDHNGDITFTSKEGEGTKFTVVLPLQMDIKNINVSAESKKNISNLNVMIVEDDKDLNNILNHYLTSLGSKALSFFNGLEAVEDFKSRMNFYDLIILDMTMPKMNGRDTFYAVRKMNPDVRVIFISGYDLDGVHTEILSEPEVIGFLHKPFKKQELIDLINKKFNIS